MLQTTIHPKVVKVGESIERERLEDLLTELRYKKTDFVSHPGEYALRGSTFDIYPVTYRSPVRLEFEMEEVASIHDFSPLDGKSLAHFEEVFLFLSLLLFFSSITSCHVQDGGDSSCGEG